MLREDGFYWLVSERSSMRGVGQWFAGMWYLINEAAPVREEDLIARGWEPIAYIGTAVKPERW